MGLEKFNDFDEKKHPLALPMMAQIELTDRCNYRCVHCYNKEAIDHGRGLFDLSEEQMLGVIAGLIRDGVFSIVLTGGEPMTRRSLLMNALDLCHQHGTQVYVNTNLSLLDDEVADILKQKASALLVSCPSSDPAKYAAITDGGNYQRFTTKLSLALAKKINMTINMVVNKKNLHEIRVTADAMARLGVKSFAATPMVFGCRTIKERDALLSHDDIKFLVDELTYVGQNMGLAVDIIESLPTCAFPPEILAKNLSFVGKGCDAGRGSVTISSRGDVRPCSDAKIIYGNIQHESLAVIYQKMSEWRDGTLLPQKCHSCAIVDKCYGACRVQAYNYSDCQDRRAEDPWMTEPFDKDPMPRKPQVAIGTVMQAEDKIIFHRRDFVFREESGKSCYTIFSLRTRSHQSINKEFFDFFLSLYRNECPPGTVGELASLVRADVKSPAFQGALKVLAAVGFMQKCG